MSKKSILLKSPYFTFPKNIPFRWVLIIISLSIILTITYWISIAEKPTDDIGITDIDWNNPPCSPENLGENWQEVTDARMKEFIYKDTQIKIAFDKGRKSAPKFRGKNHWHRYNPLTTGIQRNSKNRLRIF